MILPPPRTDLNELTELRQALGLTQAKMAEIMEVPFRTYQALEGGQNPVKPMHLKAARYAAIEYVVAQSKGEIAAKLPVDIRQKCGNVRSLEDEFTGEYHRVKRPRR